MAPVVQGSPGRLKSGLGLKALQQNLVRPFWHVNGDEPNCAEKHQISTASLEMARLLRRDSSVTFSDRVLRPEPPANHVNDPATATASMPFVYGPGASRAVRPGCFQRLVADSLAVAGRKHGGCKPFTADSSSSRTIQSSCVGCNFEADAGPTLSLVHNSPQSHVREDTLSSNYNPQLRADVRSRVIGTLVLLRCGHELSQSQLQHTLQAAKAMVDAGLAAEGSLVCPLCGEVSLSHPDALESKTPRPTCFSRYVDVYAGELRKDWREPLKLPSSFQSPTRGRGLSPRIFPQTSFATSNWWKQRPSTTPLKAQTCQHLRLPPSTAPVGRFRREDRWR
jgi:hypothetical protein